MPTRRWGLMYTSCKYLLVAVCVLVTGCSSSGRTARNDSSVLEAEALSAFAAYRNCMENAAEYYSSSTSTPYEVADAAQSKCGSQFFAYERSTEKYFLSVVSSSGGSIARGKARALTLEGKNSVKGKVVQKVVESRLQKK